MSSFRLLALDRADTMHSAPNTTKTSKGSIDVCYWLTGKPTDEQGRRRGGRVTPQPPSLDANLIFPATSYICVFIWEELEPMRRPLASGLVDHDFEDFVERDLVNNGMREGQWASGVAGGSNYTGERCSCRGIRSDCCYLFGVGFGLGRSVYGRLQAVKGVSLVLMMQVRREKKNHESLRRKAGKSEGAMNCGDSAGVLLVKRERVL